MAYVVMFEPKKFTTDQYDSIVKKLDQAGAGNPEGRIYHICYGDSDQLRVIDVWESKESFEDFGKTMLPLAKQLDFDPGQPKVVQVYNTITGQKD